MPGRFCFSSSCFFSRSLRFHIASDRFECCAAHTPHIVSPVPEIRFLVERLEMLGKAVRMRLELAVFRLLISVEILSAGWISTSRCT